MLIKEEREREKKKRRVPDMNEEIKVIYFFNQKQVRIYSNKVWISFSFFFFHKDQEQLTCWIVQDFPL